MTEAVGIELEDDPESVVAGVARGELGFRSVERRGSLELLRVSLETAQRSVVRTLPGDSMGTVLDPSVVEADLVDGLHLIGRIPEPPTRIALAIEVGPTTLITEGTVADLERSSATMLKTGKGPLKIEPDETVEVEDLAAAAESIARDLVPVIMKAWEWH